ncbi:MAG: hypothetical protein M0R17_06930 [Candidatus Omnitrophica bacterium]|jgi:hypothetical protein|nr:hypothetical protein [Candidatus Omnitrophota bacterium]
MALGSTNIALTAVRNLIGASSFNLFDVGTSPLINKWSKKKPVRGAFPQSGSGKYGLNLPTNWDYLQPRGGSPGGTPDEPVRLGDFRGYEHDNSLTFPPCYCKSSDQEENGVLSPAQPSGGHSSGTAVGKFNVTPSDVRLLPSDLGIDDYYFGILITTPNSQTWIKTVSTTIGNSDEVNGNAIVYSAALNDPTSPSSTYQNLPYGVGSYTVKYVISSIAYTSWTQNPSATIIQLPSGSVSGLTFKNSFSFSVGEWIYAATGSMSWSYSADSIASYVESVIYMSEDTAFTVDVSEASFLEYRVYAADGATNITSSPSQWGSGCKLRVFPINANGGDARTGTVYVNGTNTTAYPISVTQQAAPATISIYAGNINVLTVSNTSANLVGGLKIGFTPHYVPGGDPSYIVAYLIKVNGVEAYSSQSTGIACQNDVAEPIQSISYGSATWEDGDAIDIYLYYEVAPALQ